MFRLIIGLIPWAISALGIVIFTAGLVAFLSETETAPTSVAVEAIETGQPVSKRYLHITDGVLYWPELLTYYRESRSEGDDHRVIAYFAPLVSRETASRWVDLPEQVSMPDVSHLVFVRFAPEDFRRSFPSVARGDVRDLISPFEPQGEVESSIAWPREFRNYLGSGLGIPTSDVLVLRDGSEPIQDWEAAAMVVVGLVLAAAGSLWGGLRIKRRRTAVTMSGELVASAHGAEAAS